MRCVSSIRSARMFCRSSACWISSSRVPCRRCPFHMVLIASRLLCANSLVWVSSSVDVVDVVAHLPELAASEGSRGQP